MNTPPTNTRNTSNAHSARWRKTSSTTLNHCQKNNFLPLPPPLDNHGTLLRFVGDSYRQAFVCQDDFLENSNVGTFSTIDCVIPQVFQGTSTEVTVAESSVERLNRRPSKPKSQFNRYFVDWKSEFITTAKYELIFIYIHLFHFFKLPHDFSLRQHECPPTVPIPLLTSCRLRRN